MLDQPGEIVGIHWPGVIIEGSKHFMTASQEATVTAAAWANPMR
jgi:hypothetical protein